MTRLIAGGAARVLGLALVLTSCFGDSTAAPRDEEGSQDSQTVIALVRSWYQSAFYEVVPKPAVFDHPEAGQCNGRSGYLTTTAYLPAERPGERLVYALHLSRDGKNLAVINPATSRRLVPVPPAGTFKVLTVLLTWPATFAEAQLPGWVRAQSVINQQHADFAVRHRYLVPIVRFEFTNVLLPGPQIPYPDERNSVILRLEELELRPGDYDFLALVNLNPSRVEGGFAATGGVAPYFVYMGNYGPFSSQLTETQLQNVANAVYHHEIGHHWGWEHEWSSSCDRDALYQGFITAPILFGWEDSDDDGVPEILDPTPYGRVP